MLLRRTRFQITQDNSGSMTSDILRKTANRYESKIRLSIETHMFQHHQEEYIMMALLA